MTDHDRYKLLMTIQAKINQIEMLRQRGVDLSRAEVFWSWSEKDGQLAEETILVDEEAFFPDWINVIQMEEEEQNEIIDRFNEAYSLLTQDGNTILNTRYPSVQYPMLDEDKNPLDHIYVFYPFPKENGKIGTSELIPLIAQFMPDVTRNQDIIGSKNRRLDDVIIIFLTDVKVTIPGELKQNYGKRIQIVYHDQIYPPTHIMYSKHEKIPLAEANKLLADMDAKRAQMPRLYENELICRYYGWYPNDLIRITRRASGIPTIIRSSIVEAVVVAGDPPFPKVLSKIIY